MKLFLHVMLCLSIASALMADTPSLGLGRYKVTIASDRVDDPDVITQLLATCRCRLEPYAEIGFNGVMIRASEATARLLGSDPRILRVEEVRETPVAAVIAPVTSTAIATTAPPSVAIAPDARPVTEANAPPWDSGVYTYDGAGNISKIGTAKTYVYDRLGRLVSGGEMTSGNRQEYTYDRNANLRTITTYKPNTSPAVRTISVDMSSNRVTAFQQNGGSTPALYDGAGRLTQSPDGAFVYDAGDMVIESTIGTAPTDVRAVHLYTASDERVATIAINGKLGSDYTIRDLSGKVLRRFKQPSPSAAWFWDEDYIYRDGQLLAAEVLTPERTLHFHPDHLGTPRVITGVGGAKVWTPELHPFGEQFGPVDPNNPDYERMKFTGHERDADSLDYMHARYYAVQWGRFLSVDPVNSANTALPQSWNRYAYSANNPLNKIDPDGRATRPYERVAQAAGGAATIIETVGAVLCMGDKAQIVAAPLRTIEKMMRLGDATGDALGKNANGSKLAAAVVHDVGVASEATLLMAGAAAPAGRAATTTQLFRAVDASEATDIAASGSFRASPNGTEFKGFFFKKADAQALGEALSQQTGDAYSVVSGRAPTSLVRTSPPHQAAGEGAGVLIRNEDLEKVTPTLINWNAMHITIFGTSSAVDLLAETADVIPNVAVLAGAGPAITAKQRLDAFIMPLMQAERFGANLASAPFDRAVILRTASADIAKGLPRFIVAGVRTRVTQPRDWAGELELFLTAAFEAIVAHNAQQQDPIERVGILLDNLFVDKVGSERAIDLLRIAAERYAAADLA
jgi:RHS repeat-associated protein